jgi:hypothetical protein
VAQVPNDVNFTTEFGCPRSVFSDLGYHDAGSADVSSRPDERRGCTDHLRRDGNRVKKVTSSGTTTNLVDDLNPTAYPQVVEELTNGAVSRTYTPYLEEMWETRVV